MNVRQELLKEAAERGLWSKGDIMVVAVSGGPDSMALLHLLHSLSDEQGLKLVAAHADHGFRGEESASELRFVAEYAQRLGVPCESVTLDMPAYIEETRMNAQAAAREKRYEFLHRTATKWGAASIALAHHADDQAETVLMRLLRGTGLTGLAGMQSIRREKNVQLIRPLLRMNKSDLVDYCESQGVPYCIDSSNFKRHYWRNRVRLDVLPYLMQYNPQLPQTLLRLADVAGAENDWLDSQASELFGRLVQARADECRVNCSELTGVHVALQRRLIKLILNYLSRDTDLAAFEAIEAMRLAAAPEAPATWRMDAGDGIRCVREYGVIRWIRISERPEFGGAEPYAVEVNEEPEGRIIVPGGWTFRFRRIAAEEGPLRPASRFEACFDASRLQFPLTIRNRRPGDRIQILGLNGSKKVQDMFVDEKIPPSERPGYPLLFDAEGKLLWIPGLRRSSHAAVEQDAGEAWLVQAERE